MIPFANQLSKQLVKPEDDAQARGDPYRTLFVARLSYEAKEQDLEREFGRFGPIERVRCIPYTPVPYFVANTSASDSNCQRRKRSSDIKESQ